MRQQRASTRQKRRATLMEMMKAAGIGLQILQSGHAASTEKQPFQAGMLRLPTPREPRS